MNNNKNDQGRRWVVVWMYGVAVGHLIVGLLLPLVSGFPFLEIYHEAVEPAFWKTIAPTEARQQQIWWMSLFGPTIQVLSIWMGVMVYIADRQRLAWVWAWLAIGVLIWAPQDIWISLQRDAWVHVWVDVFAVLTMLPPLLWLFVFDARKGEKA